MSSVVARECRPCVAIVGASVRAAAQSALRAGFDVVGADLFADADLDGVCPVTRIDDYPNGFAAWLTEQRADAWMYTGALENYPELVDRMATIAPLWGVRGEPLRRCRDPIELGRVFADSGIAFPKTLPRGVRPNDADFWLAKTYRHSAGAGTVEYGFGWSAEADPAKLDAYPQKIVAGEPHAAVYALSDSGSRLLGVTEQLLGEGDACWSYRGSIGPIDLYSQPPSVAASLERVGSVLAGELGLRGVVGVDVLIEGDTLTVVEVNPRYPASAEVLERASGQSVLAQHASAFGGDRSCEWEAAPGRVAAKQVVYARGRITVDERLAELLQALHRTGDVADLPREGTSIEAGQPVCTALGHASSVAKASAALFHVTGILSGPLTPRP
ncbi:MAG: ATP-grasp domain-containing protein [Planctomycetota bacterium]